MQSILPILAALAEPTRFGAISLLWPGGERSVADLMARLGATQSRMSRHMSVLRAAGLVIARRDAQWVRYQRNPELDPALAQLVDSVLALSGRKRRPNAASGRPANGTNRQRRRPSLGAWSQGVANRP